MTIELTVNILDDEEKAALATFNKHIYAQHHVDLANFLFTQLQTGHAYILDIKSPEFKALTRWQ